MTVILDTGVLIAYLMLKDKYHHWAVSQLSQVRSPLLTNEAVITEACFLAQRVYHGQETILRLIGQGHIVISFSLHSEIETVESLMRRYTSVPMSLADACLVRMSELYNDSAILTLDSDFTIYRKHRNQTIPVIMPSND
ncbi:type II toxin-antitoxin system VapC family toxin [Roseofilum casamattae]|uniref:PIN domain-containing protein n=1 Tax=Roseofilum casamattae BLCC-M143 TaxID=3022442 RepID=A0ABT7BY79_9CYAN|nr:PIN domain-containing protein [Roseofilum casamattae]MDJ1184158.1 PIN domain-containing protein [Roseofilum casamattae BLCC-M143]